jgi:LmbE family N-acetylglucosaminyl deacetylase
LKLLVSPHQDDAVLFAAYTLQREKPLVLTVYDSFIQVERGHKECTAIARRCEDLEAMNVLGCQVQFGGVPDTMGAEAAQRINTLLDEFEPEEVWLPAVEIGGHEHHNLVGLIGGRMFSMRARIHRYLTYTRTGGKSTGGTEVQPTGAMVRRKLLALACYKTQLEIDALGCWPHFMDLREFAL